MPHSYLVYVAIVRQLTCKIWQFMRSLLISGVEYYLCFYVWVPSKHSQVSEKILGSLMEGKIAEVANYSNSNVNFTSKSNTWEPSSEDFSKLSFHSCQNFLKLTIIPPISHFTANMHYK